MAKAEAKSVHLRGPLAVRAANLALKAGYGRNVSEAATHLIGEGARALGLVVRPVKRMERRTVRSADGTSEADAVGA